ncbi:MAG: PAS domain S-box protein [Dongiaceae bacterium]
MREEAVAAGRPGVAGGEAGEDQEFLARVIEAVPDAVLVKDERHRFVLLNSAFARLMGRTAATLLGHTDFDFVPPEEAGLFWRIDEEVLASGEPHENREILTDAAGRQHHLVARKSLVVAPGGRRYIVAVLSDVTERVLAERSLQQSEERFRNLIEGSIQGIVIQHRGRPLFANQAFAGIFGYAHPGEILALGDTYALTAPEDVGRLRGYGEARLRGAPAPAIFEHQAIRRDGSRIWLENRSRAVDWNGVRAIQSVCVDITERKRAEQALIAARDQADRANRAKSEFLARVSHELRTPLNGILGFSELMRTEALGPLGGRYREFSQDIHDSGAHLLAIINDILDIAKVEAGRLELREEEFGLAELLDTVRRLVAGRAEAAGLALAVDAAAGLPALRADRRALKQVLLNLLSNAIKFTPAGGAVRLQAARGSAGDIVLVVRDDGIGISAEDIPRVLEPFGQVDSALARRHAGAGLGLTISRALVELHGGRLELDSMPGLGTTVTVRLPPERVLG